MTNLFSSRDESWGYSDPRSAQSISAASLPPLCGKIHEGSIYDKNLLPTTPSEDNPKPSPLNKVDKELRLSIAIR